MSRLFLSAFAIFLYLSVDAQKIEIGVHGGVANYLGDIGGKRKDAKPFFFDMHLPKINFAFGADGVVQFHHLYQIKGSFSYLRIGDSDALSIIETRRRRNLSFRNSIIEFSAVGQLDLLELIGSIQGHTYRDFQTVARVRTDYPFYIYPYIGFGIIYSNPKTRYNGGLVALRPLGTEGQGVIAGKKKYSPIQPIIPMGIEFQYQFNPKMKVGFDWGLRKSFTDYLDDISGTYADPTLIAAAHGSIAAALSNRTAEYTTNPDDLQYYVPGAIRGNPKRKDYYMTTTFTFIYRLDQGRRAAVPKFKRTNYSIARRLKRNRKRKY